MDCEQIETVAVADSQRSMAGFVSASTSWAALLLAPIARLANLLQRPVARLGLGETRLAREHGLFFALATLAFALVTPRYVVALGGIPALLAGEPAALGLARYPYLPNKVPAFLLVFLLTFFLERKWRFVALFVCAAPIAMGLDARFGLPSLAAYALFLALAFFVIRIPASRFLIALLLAALSMAFAAFCHQSALLGDRPIANMALFFATFIPMIWYSAYEQRPPKQRLSPWRYLGFHIARVFGAPVLTYRDLFQASPGSLARLRFDGFKALFVASFAATFSWAVARRHAGLDAAELAGLPLLVYSYLHFVANYCLFVVGVNSFIGVARLFGLPVRDNFHYWLLARTPNEHWRRWNILLREWIITYIFYPIMRAKRWLFVAVMASLLASGLLHLIPHFMRRPALSFNITSKLCYWTIHGLAIYAVIKIPLIWPGWVERLRMRDSRAWSVAGVILTSIFYGTVYTASTRNESWSEVADYFARLVGSGGSRP